jgi:multidrug efflux pump subunit AcrB
MIFSLLVAFIVSPWLSYIVLKNVKHSNENEAEEEQRESDLHKDY